MLLSSPVSTLYKVGPIQARALLRLGIKSRRDLLFHFPRYHQDFSQTKDINKLAMGETATIRGKVVDISVRKIYPGRRSLIRARVADKTDSINIIWFNQPFLAESFPPGSEIILSGEVTFDLTGPMMKSPVFEKVRQETTHTGRLVPVYPETARITSKRLRFLIKSELSLARQIKDYLPENIKKKNGLINLPEAVSQIHFPENKNALEKARERLSFDELFCWQIIMQSRRQKWQKAKAAPIKFNQKLAQKFVQSLDFELTPAQKKAMWEILKDLEKKKPMNRLLEGDVGSGKTVVALMAMLHAARANFQAALIAPTEILAAQHFTTVTKLLKPFDIEVLLFTRARHASSKSPVTGHRSPGIDKSVICQRMASGSGQIVIGTHALLQKDVKFKDLGLIVVDEQHRFGVKQRAHLEKTKSRQRPHLLTMTATPIPRTLALTAYGDLDLSRVDQLPSGRKKIFTKIVSPQNRIKAYAFIKKHIRNGEQVFVICPLIEESEKLTNKAAVKEYRRLQDEVFPDLRVALLHGKIKPEQKEKTMQKFAHGKIDILVATSVVEVGIDVPKATIIIIEGAERFGLAQLHQLRGRVGRSERQSYCFLFAESKSDQARQRLSALVESNDGFKLAAKDLKLRGPGEMYGTRQSGFLQFKIADLTDLDLIQKTRSEAARILAEDPGLEKIPVIKKKIAQIAKTVHLE